MLSYIQVLYVANPIELIAFEWTKNGKISSNNKIAIDTTGTHKFKTVTYNVVGISENEGTFKQIGRWFQAQVGTIEYNNAVDQCSAILDGQVKILDEMLRKIDVTYDATNNKSDPLTIVTAKQLSDVFDSIDASINKLGTLDTSDGKKSHRN